jgi:Cft2 family RNA processing exonuclease
MLGAAQILLEHDGWRLLYTGDLKLRRASQPATQVPRADVLVLESTYGRPHFLFPEPDSVLAAVAIWCRRCLDARVTPVLLAHAVGKAQELMVALGCYGFEFALERRCMAYSDAYEAAGIRLPAHEELDPLVHRDRVVIAPPTGKEDIRRLPRYRSALVSGWAMESSFWRIFGADVAFPYSDHCDFAELVQAVIASGAEQVYTVHGFAQDLARHLRKRGFRASPLNATEQLALGL